MPVMVDEERCGCVPIITRTSPAGHGGAAGHGEHSRERCGGPQKPPWEIQVPAQDPPHGCYNGVCPLLHHLISPGCKQMHSWFMRPNFLPWAMTSDNAPFDLKIGEELGLELLSTFQGGGCDYVA